MNISEVFETTVDYVAKRKAGVQYANFFRGQNEFQFNFLDGEDFFVSISDLFGGYNIEIKKIDKEDNKTYYTYYDIKSYRDFLESLESTKNFSGEQFDCSITEVHNYILTIMPVYPNFLSPVILENETIAYAMGRNKDNHSRIKMEIVAGIIVENIQHIQDGRDVSQEAVLHSTINSFKSTFSLFLHHRDYDRNPTPEKIIPMLKVLFNDRLNIVNKNAATYDDKLVVIEHGKIKESTNEIMNDKPGTRGNFVYDTVEDYTIHLNAKYDLCNVLLAKDADIYSKEVETGFLIGV